jgi:hypothetical protein
VGNFAKIMNEMKMIVSLKLSEKKERIDVKFLGCHSPMFLLVGLVWFGLVCSDN